MPTEDPPGFLPKGGNYQALLSYRKSEIIFDFTFRFCEKFLQRGDRTIDQMVQAARCVRDKRLWPKDSTEALYVRQ